MNKDFSYTIRKSKRAKLMRLVVHRDGRVVVTSPFRVSQSIIENFVFEKTRWIQGKINYFKNINNRARRTFSRDDYLKSKSSAFMLAQERVVFYNKIYKFSYKKIYIKNQKTRWGSCSINGNINLNYKILFLPRELRDYIIVHEVCHLKEMNHSRKFWLLVSYTFPDYLELRAKLRQYNLLYN